MKRTFLSRCCLPLYIIGIHLLAGCATQQTNNNPPPSTITVPTAVIYDRALDKFHVEVIEVPEGETPVYLDRLGFTTLIDGERRGGLVPPPTRYEKNGRKFVRLWAAPVIVYRKDTKDTEWHVERKKAMISKEQEPETSLMHTVHIYNSDSSVYPVYFIHIEHVRFSFESSQ